MCYTMVSLYEINPSFHELNFLKEYGECGPTRLSGQDLGGIFVLLLVGILLACVIACGECLIVWWRKRQDHEVKKYS